MFAYFFLHTIRNCHFKHFLEKLALIPSCCSVGVDVQFRYDRYIFYMETAKFCQLKCYRQFGLRD